MLWIAFDVLIKWQINKNTSYAFVGALRRDAENSVLSVGAFTQSSNTADTKHPTKYETILFPRQIDKSSGLDKHKAKTYVCKI